MSPAKLLDTPEPAPWPEMHEVWLFPTTPGELEDGLGRRGWTALWRPDDGRRRAQCFFTQLGKLSASEGWQGRKVTVLGHDPTEQVT